MREKAAGRGMGNVLIRDRIQVQMQQLRQPTRLMVVMLMLSCSWQFAREEEPRKAAGRGRKSTLAEHQMVPRLDGAQAR